MALPVSKSTNSRNKDPRGGREEDKVICNESTIESLKRAAKQRAFLVPGAQGSVRETLPTRVLA